MVDDLYSARAAFKQNRRLVFNLLDKIEQLVGDTPEDVNFGHVGDLVEARSKLEKALIYLQSLSSSERGNKLPSKTGAAS